MQTNAEHFSTSALGAMRLTLQKEGVRGLYRGYLPPLFGWLLMDPVGLGTLNILRN